MFAVVFAFPFCSVLCGCFAGQLKGVALRTVSQNILSKHSCAESLSVLWNSQILNLELALGAQGTFPLLPSLATMLTSHPLQEGK